MMDVADIGNATIVRIREEIDVVSAERLEHVIRTVELTQSRRILLSLEECPYCDSTCLAIVLRAAYRIGPRLGVIVPLGTAPRRLFEITGIAQEPYVYASTQAALAVAI